MPVKKELSKEQVLSKIKQYCTYQERCHQEVRDKLYSLGSHKPDVEQILSQLIEEDYLNEERFAVQYAGGKFRMKGWGLTKIRYELRQKGVSDHCIKLALKVIDASDYADKLEKTAIKKWKTLNGSIMTRKAKLFLYLRQKGYETNEVQKVIERFVASA